MNNKSLLCLFIIICAESSTKTEKVKIKCDQTIIIIDPNIGKTIKCCYIKGKTKILTSNVVVENKMKYDLSIQVIEFRYSSEIHFIPQGLKNSYPKLKWISFQDQPLKNLNKNDLEQFGSDLKGFRADRCDITSIEKNLFMHNPNLEYISFRSNPLKIIGPGFFGKISLMRHFKRIDLKDCSCIDHDIIDRDSITKMAYEHNCTHSLEINLEDIYMHI